MTAIPFINSLNFKLVLAFTGTALLSVALASFLSARSTTSDFRSYVMDQQAMQQHMGGAVAPQDGMMGGSMMGGGPMMGTREGAFLSDMRRSLWVSGGITAAAALGLAIVISRQITGPTRRLAAAAADVAGGRLATRVEKPGRDEIGRLGEAFNSMTEALEQQEQLRQSMIADIAHELRTPLSVLRGNLEAMLDNLLEPSAKELGVLHGQSVALSRLIEDLRTLSLASAGHLELRRRPADLGELARGVAAELEAAARQKGVALSVEAPSDLPQTMVDGERIGQVLRNLMDNALRYTPAGGRVDVRAIQQAKQVQVSVADTGTGIAPEDLPHVFDRFYRADGSRARATGGSGLGLAIVKQLVEAHGGRVWADSQPGNGSQLHFSVPIA